MSIKRSVIIFRHGARFPNVVMPADLSFTNHDGFWNTHCASIMPVGIRQLETLGRYFKKRYPSEFQLLKVRTSDTNRSIMSGISFIEGFKPKHPKTISHETDAHNGEIIISPGFFHHNKNGEEYKTWRDLNFRRSPEIKDLEQKERVGHLLDKLYKMTHFEPIRPGASDRVPYIKSFATQILISKYQNIKPFPNKKGIQLTPEEELLTLRLSDLVYGLLFRPYNNLRAQGIGFSYAGPIFVEMVQFLISDQKGFQVYSGHDTTILALSEMLGIRIPNPRFAGFILFEVYDDQRLEFYFVSDPKTETLETPKRLPRKAYYISYDDLEPGPMSLDEFKNVSEIQKAFASGTKDVAELLEF